MINQPIRIYFDTEFTSFEDGKLISIGLIHEDGSEKYFEFSDGYHLSDCSDFVVDHILPLLEIKKQDRQNVSKEIVQWIKSQNKDVVFVCNDPFYDWPLLEQLISSSAPILPSNLLPYCECIYDSLLEESISKYEKALKDFFIQYKELQHHSLWDVRAMFFALQKIQFGDHHSIF